MPEPTTVAAAFVQTLAPDQYQAYTDRIAEREAAIIAACDAADARTAAMPQAPALLDAYRAEVLAEAADLIESRQNVADDRAALDHGALTDEETAAHLAVRRMALAIREVAGKDTGGATQAPAGESTQPAPDLMPAIRAAIASFDFDAYGAFTEHDRLGVRSDAEWVGDLASAIAGALPTTGGNDEPAPDFFQPGHGYTHRDGSDFLCVAVTTHPASGERLAIGWCTDLTGLRFLVHRHIGHWLHEYDGRKPTGDATYAATRGKPGGDA